MNEWIKVEDELPTINNQRVLIYCKTDYGKEILTGQYNINHKTFIIFLPSLKFNPSHTNKENIDFTHWEIIHQDLFNKVLYWMPLPEPPK